MNVWRDNKNSVQRWAVGDSANALFSPWFLLFYILLKRQIEIKISVKLLLNLCIILMSSVLWGTETIYRYD